MPRIHRTATRHIHRALEALEPRQLMSGGPSASVYAENLTSPISGSYIFSVTYNDSDNINVASLDGYDLRVNGPNGWSYGPKLVDVDLNQNGTVRVARYKISSPSGKWDASANGTYTLVLRANQVADAMGNFADPATLGLFRVMIGSQPAPAPAPGAELPPRGIHVRDFGAIPNDGIDDTDDIIAAMNHMWLNYAGDGSPKGDNLVGGVVNFEAGEYNISGPINVWSGIWIKGATSTTIKDSNRDRTSAAFILTSPYNHGFNSSVIISDLSIYTSYTAGIKCDTISGDLVDLRLLNLKISAGGDAINLSAANTYHSVIRNVQVHNPGGAALILGHIDNVNANNGVEEMRVTGVARSSFSAPSGLVVLRGISRVSGLTIDDFRGAALPLYISGRSTLTRFTVNLATTYLPTGELARIENSTHVFFDSLNNIGTGRKLKLIEAHDVSIGRITTVGGVTLGACLDADSKSFAQVNGQYAPSTTAPTMQLPTNIINAADYGVDGTTTSNNTITDDTNEIQNAINAARNLGGGIVQLPWGRIDISSRIKLYSGVILRGWGTGTVIRTLSTDHRHAAIEFLGSSSGNIRSGVMDLSIDSVYRAKGIMADPGMTGPLFGAIISNIHMTTGGTAIDLRAANVMNTRIQDIIVADPGSSALYLGRDNINSYGNYIAGIRTIGNARANFSADKAMVVLYGGTTWLGGTIEEVNAPILPLFVSGVAHISGLHWEYPAVIDGIGLLFQDTTLVRMDGTANIDYLHIIKLINAKDVNFNYLGAFGSTDTAKTILNVDANSKITIGSLDVQYDSGMYDHPRVKILGSYNRHDFNFVVNKEPLPADNLIADQSISDWSTGPDDATWKWRMDLSNQNMIVTRDVTSGKISFTVLSNPSGGNVAFRAMLNAPLSAIGRKVVARWRVDGDTQVEAYLGNFRSRFEASVINSQTSAMSRVPLETTDMIIFLIRNVTPGRTYTLSKFSLRAA